MTLGVARQHGDLLDPVAEFCDQQVGEDTIYGLLHRERHRLFPDEMFADLYTTRGRRSIPPSVLACVLVLQRLEGLSDREAADRFTYDARWRYACGVGSWQVGLISFDHSVLVPFRMRLEASDDPRRIFTVSTRVAGEAGLIGVRRVLDSAPLFDAVATMDTVTLIRSGIRGLLQAATGRLEAELRGLLTGDDDYRAPGKPVCDWDDQQARSALVDTLARDGLALLEGLEGRQVPARVAEQAELLAVLIGQDLETDDEGRFTIARKVAKDRFDIDLDADTVSCPGGHTVPIRRNAEGDGLARFAGRCATCPLQAQYTTSKTGRVVNVSRHEALLAAARERQADPDWQREYRATRPKVERKLAHMLRPGRRARRRGLRKVDADFNYTGTGINLARMARLGLRNWAGHWQIAPA